MEAEQLIHCELYRNMLGNNRSRLIGDPAVNETACITPRAGDRAVSLKPAIDEYTGLRQITAVIPAWS